MSLYDLVMEVTDQLSGLDKYFKVCRGEDYPIPLEPGLLLVVYETNIRFEIISNTGTITWKMDIRLRNEEYFIATCYQKPEMYSRIYYYSFMDYYGIIHLSFKFASNGYLEISLVDFCRFLMDNALMSPIILYNRITEKNDTIIRSIGDELKPIFVREYSEIRDSVMKMLYFEETEKTIRSIGVELMYINYINYKNRKYEGSADYCADMQYYYNSLPSKKLNPFIYKNS